ncbi:hypothetical protein ACIPPS_04320 [Streptomyces sp. NPDC090127]|uniref:hypothetical protein n=1 Tax=Streptomyces sp. NPDC090127 TaxID=3365953 RepID=UPI0037F40B7E
MRAAIRVRAGVGALLSAVVLALLPLPQVAPAAAAATGDGGRDGTAVTKKGTRGPYDDFSDLEVTVHQTRNLRAQGVRVSWKGGRPTNGTENNFLQIMQCWGDDAAGPRREQCQFGGGGGGSTFGNWTTQRTLIVGTDPRETQYDEPIPNPDSPDQTMSPFVPFQPVSGPPTRTSTDFTYFGPGDTNEEIFAPTQADGTGEAVVRLQTTREAPHLGCGDPIRQDGAPRGRSCWLVVVPRGEHEPNGDPGGNGGQLDTSALSTTNWERRIVFPLDFLAVGEPCPADKAERRLAGSELITDAITSWQGALCAGGDTRYTFTQRGEGLARQALTNASSSSAGLAFTVRPMEGGVEAGFVHAPVAVSGLTVGFFWEADSVGRVPELKLSARLLAKALTLSYPYDIRVLSDSAPVPEHLRGNPTSLVRDPEFLELNPIFKDPAQAEMNYPGGILLSADRSDVTEIVWDYLRSNADSRAFLEGKPDPWGMKVNPHFEDLGLATTGTDEFPKADPTETELSDNGRTITYGVTERSPFALDMHDAAQWVRRGTNNAKDRWTVDSVTNQLKLASADVYPGIRRAYGIMDAASASRYQIQTAALPNADGAYVKPTADSLLEAVGRFQDSAVPGVLAADPGRARNGAYPLTIVTYATASVALPADLREDYARVMRYAAGPGQKQGTAPGELPYGYVPMPADLRARASAAADALERGAVPGGPGGASGSTSGAGGTGGAGAGGGSVGGAASSGTSSGGAGADGGPGDPSAAPSAATGATASTAGGDTSPKERLADSGTTPSGALGVIRWVLLGVLVAGGAAGLAGPVMLRFSARRAAGG